MPTYDYKCNACSHRFEHFQSMKDKPLRKCPKCGKNALERLIGTGAAVLFKGSGFYQTDYRSESYKAAHKADSGSGDSKPAAGSDKGEKSGSAADSSPKAADAAKSVTSTGGESKPKPDKAAEPKKRKS